MVPRPKKQRQTRMHAAIDAMAPLGFSSKTVQSRVKALLKEYGGDDCWPFIEANAYRVLIDFILEEQEKEVKEGHGSEEGDNLLEGNGRGVEKAGSCLGGAESGPSDEVCPRRSTMGSDTAKREVGNGESDAGPSTPILTSICSEIVDPASHTIKTEANWDAESSFVAPVILQPPAMSSLLPVEAVPKARKPTYGWLSDDDDDADVKPTPIKTSAPLKRKHAT